MTCICHNKIGSNQIGICWFGFHTLISARAHTHAHTRKPRRQWPCYPSIRLVYDDIDDSTAIIFHCTDPQIFSDAPAPGKCRTSTANFLTWNVIGRFFLFCHGKEFFERISVSWGKFDWECDDASSFLCCFSFNCNNSETGQTCFQ